MQPPTQPPEIINHPSKHFSLRAGAPIRAIILHHTAGVDSLDWLTQNPNQVSTHVLITKAGLIYRMVPDDKAANTVGFSNIGNYVRLSKVLYPAKKGSANQITLNIELENRGTGSDLYTDAQYWSAGWQIAQWWNAHGDLSVATHELVDTQLKNDPYAFDVIRALRCALYWYDQ